jgi:hypothetical protein
VILGIDFDETIAEQYWLTITEVPDALRCIAGFRNELKCELMLHSNRSGFVLKMAVDWCTEHGLIFDAVNRSVHWWQLIWFAGPKPYADLWLDDRNPGTPLIYRPGRRPIIDWKLYEPMVRDLIEGKHA